MKVKDLMKNNENAKYSNFDIIFKQSDFQMSNNSNSPDIRQKNMRSQASSESQKRTRKADFIMEADEEQIESDGSDEEEQLREKERSELEKLEKKIREREARNRANEQVFVGSGFGLDQTQFFLFRKQKQLASTGEDSKSVFEELSGGHLSWLILIYYVCNTAMIPAWIMNIKATKLLRISWRFLLQAFMIIPFVLYEKRKADAQTLEKYKLSYIFDFNHLYIAYISSLSTSFWFTVILTSFEWTYVSHAIFLSALVNYFLSIKRTKIGKGHDLEPGGQVLVTIGVIFMIIDIYLFNPETDAKPQDHDFINPFYLNRTRIQSVLADFIALSVSYCLTKFKVYTDEVKNHYPPFLSLLLINSMVCINMMFSTYFFNGATFDFDPFWGIFSIVSQLHFSTFLYMAIILCMGLVISSVMLSNLFSDPLIPSLAMTFEPALSTLFLYLAGIQTMPPALSFMGYILIIPGNLLILIGQSLFQFNNKKQKKEEEDEIAKLKQISQQKRIALKRIVERDSERNSERRDLLKRRSREIELKEYKTSPQRV